MLTEGERQGGIEQLQKDAEEMYYSELEVKRGVMILPSFDKAAFCQRVVELIAIGLGWHGLNSASDNWFFSEEDTKE